MISAVTLHYCVIILAFLQYNLIVRFNNIYEILILLFKKKEIEIKTFNKINSSNQSL